MMPKQGQLFLLFEAHSATLVSGANSLEALSGNSPLQRARITELAGFEHDADIIGAIVGVDAARRMSAARWNVAGRIVFA